MKYEIIEMPKDFLADKNLSHFVKETLYYISDNELDLASFFMEDTLYPICKSAQYIAVVKKIRELISNNTKIIISGDYDCDGICATALMYRYLLSQEIEVGYYIPNRHRDGYGLSPKLVEMYHQKGYQAIICVDNGVVAHEAIKLAYSYQMEVIVLDHHEMDKNTLDYPYVLHPNLMSNEFFGMCGSGVVFEVLRGLKNVDELDTILVGVATVGDMMLLNYENRFIVRLALNYLKKGYGQAFQALNNFQPFTLSDIAMRIVPRINATGRLYDRCNVNNIVKFLISDNGQDIKFVAAQVENINKERQLLTKAMLDKYDLDLGFSYPAIFIKGEIHDGIVGLVASSLVNKYQRFTMIVNEENGICKGSIRSIAGVDIVKMLRDYPTLLSFGGHEMAGGISFKVEDYEDIITYISDYILKLEIIEFPKKVIRVNANELNINDVAVLNTLKPYYDSKAEPLYLMENVMLDSPISYLSNGVHCKWKIDDMEVIYFNQQINQLDLKQPCTLIGNIDLNCFRNKKSISFKIVDVFNLTS